MYVCLILSTGKNVVHIFAWCDGTTQGTQSHSWLPWKWMYARLAKANSKISCLGLNQILPAQNCYLPTPSHLPKNSRRNKPNSWFSDDKAKLDPGCWQAWEVLWVGTTDTNMLVSLLFSDNFLFSVSLTHHSYILNSTGFIFLSWVLINFRHL